MSRYGNILADTENMKELITEINKRFDQVYKKIDRLESRMDKGFVKVNRDMTEIKEILKKLTKMTK